jgi:predicted mannosyl-3-phosphoglycerate phosphatase (HAD superfamily)
VIIPLAPPVEAPPLTPQPHAPSASVVIIADAGCLLSHPRALAEVRPAFEALSRCDMDVVLCADRDAETIVSLQNELGLRHPFISDKGAALHIPRGFFSGQPAAPGESEWEVIDFGMARLGHAVRLIVALYEASGSRPLTVGIGEEWRHRTLLREVDAPVVVRNSAIDQARLIDNVPSAYVTEEEGARGWLEAILGHCSAGDA